MSFVPAPQQANAASNATQSSNNAAAAAPGGTVTTAPGPAPEISDLDRLFKLRTFDVYWVEKHSLMYRDGIAKVRYHLFAFRFY